jgi:tetratricopeptide (TPR) repeat protein
MHHGKGWRVRLDLESTDAAARSVQADGDDPIETARTATDRLLAMLGKAPPAASKADARRRRRCSSASRRRSSATISPKRAGSSIPRRPIGATRRSCICISPRSTGASAASTTRAQLEPLLPTLDAKTLPDLRAQALYTLAAIAIRQDRSTDALPLLEEAATLAARNDDSDMLGQAHTAIAAADVNLGRFDDAAAGFARARVAYAGNPLALARVDANEGVLDNARGHPAEALPVLERAAERFRRYGLFNDLALTVGAEIRARLFLLDNAAALAAADALWAQRTHISNPRSRQSFTLRRAQALAANGKLGEADTLLDALSREIGPTAGTGLPGDIASERARLALAKGDTNAAVEAARAAIAALPTVDEAPERARAWLTLVRSLSERGDGAADELARFTDWARTRAEIPVATLLATEAAAEHALAQGKHDEAYRLFDDAIARAERWMVPQDLAIVATGYGTRLIAAGEVERAAAVIGRVGRWADQDFDCALLQARLYRALGQTDAWRSALERARALAGERSLPKDVAKSPADAHGTQAAFEHTAQATSSNAHPAIMIHE